MAITEYYVSVAGAGAHDGTSTGNALTLTEMVTQINALGAGGGAGRRYNITGNHTGRGATDTITVQGTTTAPLILRGYNSTIGDLDDGTRDAYGALVTTNTPQITYNAGFRLAITTGGYVVVQNIKYSCNINGTGANITSAPAYVENCSFENTNTGSSATVLTISGNLSFTINSDIVATASATGCGIDCSSGQSIYGCRIVGYAGIGIGVRASGASARIQKCTISGSSTGVSSTVANGSVYLQDTTIYGCTDAVDIVSTSTPIHVFLGCHITDNSGYGIDFNSGTAGAYAVIAGCRFRDNVTADTRGFADWVSAAIRSVTTDTGGASTDYVDAATNKDFRLISTAPGYRQGFAYNSNIGACGDNVTAGSILVNRGGNSGLI